MELDKVDKGTVRYYKGKGNYTKVKVHNGNMYNEAADALAKLALKLTSAFKLIIQSKND